MLTVGLDVHHSSSSICILDEKGNRIRQEKIPGGWDLLLAALGRLREPFQICYEASTGYGTLYDRLTPLAQKVLVANPNKTRLIFQCTRKSDRVDASKIALLLHMGQVPKVHVPSQSVRSWRGLIEYRRKLVDKLVMVKNQIRALLRGQGIKGPATRQLWTKKGVVWLKAIVWPTPLESLRLECLLEEAADITRQIKRVVLTLDQQSQDKTGITLLRTAPGVGPRTAEAFLAYIDDPERFAAGTIGAYLGLVPREDSSGSQRRLGHITHEGPGTVRKLLAEAAWRARRDSVTAETIYQRLLNNDKKRRKIALVGLTHWLARALLAMLQKDESFREITPLNPAAPLTSADSNPPASSTVSSPAS